METGDRKEAFSAGDPFDLSRGTVLFPAGGRAGFPGRKGFVWDRLCGGGTGTKRSAGGAAEDDTGGGSAGDVRSHDVLGVDVGDTGTGSAGGAGGVLCELSGLSGIRADIGRADAAYLLHVPAGQLQPAEH